MGKPLTGALADVDEARDFTYFMAGLTESGVGQTSLNSPKHVNITLREPFGVVASIIPWNFPTNIVRTACLVALAPPHITDNA